MNQQENLIKLNQAQSLFEHLCELLHETADNFPENSQEYDDLKSMAIDCDERQERISHIIQQL